jgi:hypothetical protein
LKKLRSSAAIEKHQVRRWWRWLIRHHRWHHHQHKPRRKHSACWWCKAWGVRHQTEFDHHALCSVKQHARHHKTEYRLLVVPPELFYNGGKPRMKIASLSTTTAYSINDWLLKQYKWMKRARSKSLRTRFSFPHFVVVVIIIYIFSCWYSYKADK